MQYFKSYTSNSVAGSGNQLWYTAEEAKTGRIFYRIEAGGTFLYSLLFSNVIDSTYADGSKSRKNLICKEWNILGARIGRLKKDGIPKDFTDPKIAKSVNGSLREFQEITFGGATQKTVAPGEFFTTDPMELSFESGDYLCLEMTVIGQKIPYHEESLLPVFVLGEDGWKYDRRTPFAGMIGCNRTVKSRIGFLGDSITQGIGVSPNSYSHWNAVLAQRMGEDFAFWNLGLGYGRADDMASDGAWLYKARQNDWIILCAGVNDLLRGFSAEETVQNLKTVITTLKSEGVRIVLQTVPPFDYTPEKTLLWNRVNGEIKAALATDVDLVFDTVPILGEASQPQKAIYGGHPNAAGCKAWGDALYAALTALPEFQK